VSKGATVSQEALTQAARSIAQATQISPTDGLQSNARFDGPASVFSVLVPLAAGARIVEPAGGRDAVAKGTTGMLGSPAELRATADALDAAAPFLFITYGPISSALAAKLSARPRRAFSLMASEKLGLPTGVHELLAGDSRRMLGRPLRGVHWRVADDRGRYAPIGVTGALFVETIQELPTGDRARLLSDGSFEWMGRVDGRLRLDEGLVDPRAVAETLSRHSAVREAWVTTRDDASGATRLVAYYASRPHVPFTETELRECARRLGEEHVPKLFVEVDELPRDAAGVVDDERLPSPYAASGVHDYVPPRSTSEQYLAKVWRETLNVQRIGVHDNFFDLGGHSLLCFRILARVQEDTGKRISPRVVLLNTLAQVAAQLDSDGQAGPATDGRAASPPPREAPRTLGGRLLDRLKGFVKG
jgi:nonribosomal peptide synthetase DhbF